MKKQIPNFHGQIVVSSPLVKEPVAVRYAWARAPMANLKVNGLPWLPLPSFRTEEIDFSAEVAHQDSDGPKQNTLSSSALTQFAH